MSEEHGTIVQPGDRPIIVLGMTQADTLVVLENGAAKDNNISDLFMTTVQLAEGSKSVKKQIGLGRTK